MQNACFLKLSRTPAVAYPPLLPLCFCLCLCLSPFLSPNPSQSLPVPPSPSHPLLVLLSPSQSLSLSFFTCACFCGEGRGCACLFHSRRCSLQHSTYRGERLFKTQTKALCSQADLRQTCELALNPSPFSLTMECNFPSAPSPLPSVSHPVVVRHVKQICFVSRAGLYAWLSAPGLCTDTVLETPQDGQVRELLHMIAQPGCGVNGKENTQAAQVRLGHIGEAR